jgi:hypothetical protein
VAQGGPAFPQATRLRLLPAVGEVKRDARVGAASDSWWNWTARENFFAADDV